MLLRCIYFNENRTGIILSEHILNRIKIVLTHIAQATSIIIPIASEFCMYSLRVIRLVWCRTKPEVVIQLRRDRHWLKIIKTAPVEFPVVTCYAADCYFKRPSKHPAIDKFLQRFHGCSQTIELVLKPEPGIQPEHPAIFLNCPNNLDTFSDCT